MGVSPMLRVLPQIGGTPAIQQERSDLPFRREERSALVYSIEILIEIAEYRAHGRDAHETWSIARTHNIRMDGVVGWALPTYAAKVGKARDRA
jgi:hypothetical protein